VTDDPAGDDRIEWWNERYREREPVPWDTGRPQPAILDRAAAGDVRGRVIDVGCGAGTEALALADRGHEVVGVDFAAAAVERARARAAETGAGATFRVADALALAEAEVGSFETAVDCGLLHALGPADRRTYTGSLASVVDPGGRAVVLAFGAEAPEDWGPTPLSTADLRRAFGDGWTVRRSADVPYETRGGAVPGLLGVVERE
jgi:SAM-dependent methyltransferase